MPLMRVDDLTGETLDYAVATALGWRVYWEDSVEQGNTLHLLNGTQHFIERRSNFKPSTNWRLGGQLIETFIDSFQKREDYFYAHRFKHYHKPLTSLELYDKEAGAYGSTLLIAAMRCIVKSKLGNVIDIPVQILPITQPFNFNFEV